MYQDFAILAAFAFLYSISSRGLEKTLFSGAVVFTAFGFVFGPLGFGPRGLASIVFAVIVLNEKLPGSDTIVLTATYIILLSVIGHGISANPLIAVLKGKLHISNGDD